MKRKEWSKANSSFQKSRSRSGSRAHLHCNGKLKSKESWIPEATRQRMMKRELAVVKENLELKEKCQNTRSALKTRDARGVQQNRSNHINSLERSLSKEKYGIERRKSCGLCCSTFLPINLVMTVPLKAVFDIRDSWADKYDSNGISNIRMNPNLRRPPACYNQTRVCVFCAQLFNHQQEKYRPSCEAKKAEMQKVKEWEEEVRQKTINDPLSQVEKERQEEVSELARALEDNELNYSGKCLEKY